MLDISNFFQKFLNFEKDNNTKLVIVLDTIKKVINLELNKEMLEIKGDNLKINCNPVIRNEIFMHKSEIENLLKTSKIFLRLI